MPAAETSGPRIIDVFAEVACPFTHVVLQRFVRERTARGAENEVGLRVLAWPLELVNDRPMSAKDVGREVEAARAQVEPELFGGFSVDRFPASSLPAMALASAAYDVEVAKGEAVSLALRVLLFERGHDVGSPVVLAELAETHGLLSGSTAPDPDAVRAEYEDGRRRDVTGSPHFFVGDRDFFCPGLTVEKQGDCYEIRSDPSSWADFTAACFD